jgi:uncharacterized protein YkwD
MKTCSTPIVSILLSLLACAGVACGARPARDASTTAGPAADSGTNTERERISFNAPASARPVNSMSDRDVSGAVATAEGVEMRRWADMRRAQRQQREADPESRLQAEKANQARASTLPPHQIAAMEALEAALVEELNRLRSDPAGYAATLSEFRTMYRDEIVTVPGHMAVRTREGVAAVDDAISVAGSTAPMATLSRSDGLTRAARAHAYQLGHENQLGRNGGDSITLHRRMDAYGRVDGMFAENIGAVYRDARLMLLELFVDDGVETRAHRYNMIGPMFRVVGVGCSPHPAYDVVCVMSFAEDYHEASAKTKQARR